VPEQHRHWYCFSCNKPVPGLYRTGSKNSRSERLQTINTAVNESKGQGHAEAPFCSVQFSVAEPEPHIRITAPDQYYFIKDLKKFYWKKPWLHQSTEDRESQRPQQCLCRSRRSNSDLRRYKAGAGRNIYSSATLVQLQFVFFLSSAYYRYRQIG
jgi:hypothetical protein